MRRILLLALLSIIIPSLFVRAQIGPTSGDITLSITPTTPGPNQSASATLSSSAVDLTQANIVWKVNGSAAGNGKGVVNIPFTTGAIGSRTTVSASITAPEGSFSESTTLSIGSVDLLWQGSGYVPPFYEGKRLWGRQTGITFLAIPHVFSASGAGLSPSGLIYRWSENGTIIGASSGVGKSSITLPDSILGLPIDVSVDVMSDANTVLASAETSLAAINPSVLVYEDNPTYGLLFQNEAGQGIAIKNQEITLSAFPFLFSGSSRTSANINYSWLTTGAASSQAGESVTYRSQNQAAGSSNVHVTADAPNFLTQSAAKDFLVQFSGQTSL